MPREMTARREFDDEFALERAAMVRETIDARGVTDPRVLAALNAVPREYFVAEEQRALAYADAALPIVGGQTISQPYVVAAMSEALDVRPGQRCLEVGTGSGYQTAVLLELGAEVYSIEIDPQVAELGRQNLERAGYPSERLHLSVGDGHRGWPSAAPFARIIVTAAPERVPGDLLQQLEVGGRLVIPVGPEHGLQTLHCWVKDRVGDEPSAFTRSPLFGVRFVPMVHAASR